MADDIADALDFLNEQLKENASTTMTYRRGGYSVSLDVTIGQVRAPTSVMSATVTDRDLKQPSPEHGDHRFWFDAADLILNSSLTTPAEGDTIERTVSGVTTVYKLARAFNGDPLWDYDNRGHKTRIVVNARLKSVA
jgi:hypothetical protein